MGRPAKLIKRQKRVTVRYTLAEFLFIEKYALQRGVPTAEYVRAKSLDERMPRLKSPEELTSYWQLVSLANNFNKLAQQYPKQPMLTSQIINTLEELNQLINQLK